MKHTSVNHDKRHGKTRTVDVAGVVLRSRLLSQLVLLSLIIVVVLISDMRGLLA